MSQPVKIAIVYGSARANRFCDTVADWVFSQLWERSDVEILIADSADLWNGSAGPDAASPALADTLARADAFIIVTPEYNHGYPAPLKHIIDTHGSPWRAKPVAIVSYGGISGGMRATEQLRPVIAELGATVIRETVSLAYAWKSFDANGQMIDGQAAQDAFHVMAEQLLWWARALAAAREDDGKVREAA